MGDLYLLLFCVAAKNDVISRAYRGVRSKIALLQKYFMCFRRNPPGGSLNAGKRLVSFQSSHEMLHSFGQRHRRIRNVGAYFQAGFRFRSLSTETITYLCSHRNERLGFTVKSDLCYLADRSFHPLCTVGRLQLLRCVTINASAAKLFA